MLNSLLDKIFYLLGMEKFDLVGMVKKLYDAQVRFPRGPIRKDNSYLKLCYAGKDLAQLKDCGSPAYSPAFWCPNST